MATVQNIIIDQGATFYRKVILYTNLNKTVRMPLIGKIPRATLMTDKGQFIADFACALLDAATGEIALTLPRGVTAVLVPGTSYAYNLDLDDEVDGETTDRVLKGTAKVEGGQPPIQTP